VLLLILATLWLAFTQLRRPNTLEFFGLVAATVCLVKEFRKDLTGRKP
jgi:hypothetical protein